MAEFICNSKECEGRIFKSNKDTAQCIHCGSDNIRRKGNAGRRALFLLLGMLLCVGMVVAVNEDYHYALMYAVLDIPYYANEVWVYFKNL